MFQPGPEQETLTTASLPQQAHESIGGRWAISGKAYVVTAPFLIAVFMLSENGARDSYALFAVWLVIQVLGYLAFGGMLWFADRTYFRNRRTRPLPAIAVVATGGAAGATRALSIAALVAWWDVPTTNEVWIRLVMGTIIGGFWLPAQARFLARREELRQEHRALVLAQAAQLQQLELSEQERERIRHKLLAAVGKQLNASDPTADAAANEVAESVRQLSHGLWRQTYTVPSATNAQLLKHAANGAIFRPRWSVAMITLLGMVALGRTYGVMAGVAVPAAYAATVLAAAAAINRLARAWHGSPELFFALGLSLLALVPIPFAGVMLLLDLPTSAIVADVIAALLYTMLVMPLVSSTIAPAERRRIALAAMRDELSERQLRALALEKEKVEQSRRLARHLHGTVQAELSATALRGSHLEGDAVDAALVEGVLSASSAVLAASSTSDVGDSADRVSLELAELAQRWAGLVSVGFRVSDDVAAAIAEAGNTSRIVEVTGELIHNALHHGTADRVDISLSLGERGREVVLVCDDNGTGPGSGTVVPGLGSEVISLVASRWTLSARPEGCGSRAEVVIPLPDRPSVASGGDPPRSGD